MAAPQGYTSLGVIGFTDQGAYDNNATYYINDLVHYLGNIYRCKVDATVGIAPGENVNWTVFVGTPTNIVEELIAPVEVNPSENAYTAGRQFIYNDNLYEVVKSIAVGDALVNISDDPNGNIKDADRVETQVLQTRKMIAPIEESPSINAYSIGDQLIYNGLLYNVTATIAIGDSLTVGTNISLSDSVVEQLKTINTTLGDTDISGVGNSVTDAISSLNNDLANISNPNLLDNPWFIINQRGQSSYTTSGTTYIYTVDRWRTQTQSNTVNADGSITFSNTGDTMRIVSQSFESSRFNTQFRGKTITISIDAYSEDGDCILGVYDSGLTPDYQSVLTISTTRQIYKGTISLPDTIVETQNFDFNIDVPAGAKITIYKAKIEIGSISTLAMDTAPNYQQELAKCQRYFQRIGKTAISSSLYGKTISIAPAFSSSNIWMPFSLPVPLRTMPSLTVTGNFLVTPSAAGNKVTDNSNGLTINIVNFNETNMSLLNLELKDTTNNPFVVGTSYRLVTFVENAAAYIDLSADL